MTRRLSTDELPARGFSLLWMPSISRHHTWHVPCEMGKGRGIRAQTTILQLQRACKRPRTRIGIGLLLQYHTSCTFDGDTRAAPGPESLPVAACEEQKRRPPSPTMSRDGSIVDDGKPRVFRGGKTMTQIRNQRGAPVAAPGAAHTKK